MLSSLQVVEYVPNGAKIPVTNRNKLRYLDAMAQFRLSSSVREEIEAFLKGLNELIPDNLLSIFDENELELLMCGTGNFSITDFKEHHIIAGSTPEFHKVKRMFNLRTSDIINQKDTVNPLCLEL